jgi:GT2 family glycosyltransferase/glycosyltransferase involved in cell wall biosynthesis
MESGPRGQRHFAAGRLASPNAVGETGWSGGNRVRRSARRSRHEAFKAGEVTGVSREDIEAIRKSGLFDEKWYLEEYPDVKALGMDPVEHYLWVGARLKRKPSSSFDTSAYLFNHPQVAHEGLNPLLHSLLQNGRKGGHASFSGRDDIDWGGNEISATKYNGQGHLSLPVTRFEHVYEPEISIIIPIFNQISFTLQCLRSISMHNCRYSFEVIVMDDCSADSSKMLLGEIEGIRYFRNERNLGFNRNCNRGADLARGRYIVFLNNDTKVLPGWLEALRDTFKENEKVGISGSKLIYDDGRLQEAGGIIWEDASGWNWGRLQDPEHPRYNFVRDVDYISGASLMIPRELFIELGKFDDRLENSYYEDTWLAFAAREAGYRVLYQPKSVVIHYEGVTSGTDEAAGAKRYQGVNRHIFFERWQDALRSHLPNGLFPELASDRAPKAHILVIDACTPTPDQDSGSIDMFNLLRILCDLGYRVHFIPQTNFAYWGKYTERLQSIGVECICAPYYRSVRDFLSERGDMFSHAIMARTPVAEAVFDDIATLAPSARKIFYTVDMHGLREIREAELTGNEAAMTKARGTLTRELDLVSRSDVAIVLSEYEAGLLREKGHSNVVVLPLIRDYSKPADFPPFEARRDVVFIGGFQHTPNLDAVRWLYDEIWPEVRALTEKEGLPPIRLKIVGSKMPDWIREDAPPDVEPIGYVEDLDEIFHSVRLSVAPLRYGAGLKGKIATSLGYGVPTVGTSIAFEGMPVDGLNAVQFHAENSSEMAAKVVEIYSNKRCWVSASKLGRNYVRLNYSIESSKVKFKNILEEI